MPCRVYRMRRVPARKGAERSASMTQSGAPRLLAVAAWLVSGIAGALVFWIVQVVAGEGTIPQFMGEQIASGGGYAPSFAPAIGWGVHLGVSLAYAGLLAVITNLLPWTNVAARAAVTLVLALGLGCSRRTLRGAAAACQRRRPSRAPRARTGSLR